ncbi:MAG: hypothetical protein Kow0074_13290 [Candidatus Zixiibacteriota bacterium]
MRLSPVHVLAQDEIGIEGKRPPDRPDAVESSGNNPVDHVITAESETEQTNAGRRIGILWVYRNGCIRSRKSLEFAALGTIFCAHEPD